MFTGFVIHIHRIADRASQPLRVFDVLLFRVSALLCALDVFLSCISIVVLTHTIISFYFLLVWF